jgi:lipopolysaccharide transport system ATP-binding protein
MAVIVADGIIKTFPQGGRTLLRDQLRRLLSGKQKHERFGALKNVSFKVEEGESVAVIGANGSGKSTLLGLVCGLTRPDQGSIHVKGRVAALLDLTSGFHYDLTGAENIRLNASLLGLTRNQLSRAFDKIIDFSELRGFINQPLRTYSTGMVMRLAFSIAIHVDPTVLIVDEVLAVGDGPFQEKCFEKMQSFRRAGCTLLVVSHSTAMLKRVCSRAIWLDHGNLVTDGPIDQVIELYEHGREAQLRAHRS